MDRETLFRQLDRRYASKRDMLSRIPLGVDPDALWRELLDRRRSRAALLPLFNSRGSPYWYVTTDRMIAASEKVVGALLENETEFDPYTDAPTVSNLEEVYFTSYVEGSQISMQDAMDFLTGESAPRDIEEQMIANNRAAGSYARENLFMRVDAELLRELTVILTEGMDGGGSDYRTGEVSDHSLPHGEQYTFPAPQSIPQHMDEMTQLLETPQIHPLIKAAAAQAYIMILRPFPEGNERLGRLISDMILLRAGYTFLSEVSLSALIARKSYGYYEAMTNILREENGGDLTYFFEYYLDLLARAVDERSLRSERRTEENRQAEISMARTALTTAPRPHDYPPPPHGSDPGRDDESSVETGADDAAVGQENGSMSDLSGFTNVSMTNRTFRYNKVKCIEDSIKILNDYTEYGDRPIGRMASYILELISSGRMDFSTGDLQSELGFKPCIIASSLRPLLLYGVLRFIKTDRGRRYYEICTGGPEQTEVEEDAAPEEFEESIVQEETSEHVVPEEDASPGDPSLFEKITELSQSKSLKDRRIAMMLRRCFDKGEITIKDYGAISEFSKLTPDMEFAQQLGLVRKVSNQCYRILRTPSDEPPRLNRQQRRIFTELYAIFGKKVFSVEMVIASLDYSSAGISAYLHQFTLLKLLDCRKDNVYWYRFLVNPEENPEMFDLAS